MATEVDTSGPLASAQWRTWVREHPIGGALLAGFVATQVATLSGYFMNAVGLPQLNWPAFNGQVLLPGLNATAKSAGDPAAQFWAGWAMHTIDGFVFALLFVVLLWRKIPLPNTSKGNVGKGLAYGTLLGLINIGILIPYVYLAKLGIGIFSFDIPFGLQQPGNIGIYESLSWQLPFAVMCWHWVFGFFLGAMYDPSE